MPAAVLNAQRDFSAGELDTQAKRRDDQPIMRSGGRQMANWRVLNSGVIQQRSGRSPLIYMPPGSRCDPVQIQSTNYYLVFGSGSIFVYDVNGNLLATGAGPYAWTGSTIDQIVWTLAKVDLNTTDVVITYPGASISIARCIGGAWTFPPFSFATDGTGFLLVPFYRIAAPGATLTPSSGSSFQPGAGITLIFSKAVLTAAHVGVYFRFANARFVVDTVTSPTTGTATVVDQFPPCQRLTMTTAGQEAGFAVGQVVIGSNSAAQGVVTSIDTTNHYIYVQVTNYVTGFITTDGIVGPSGNAAITAISNVAPQACVVWDEQMISPARGWPQSCFSDRGRLGFCNLPQLQEAILWSATDNPYDFSIGALATNAIADLIAGRPRVLHVGAWYDEIVFTDQGIWYVPIGTTGVLQPGSVSFIFVSNEAAAPVKPAFTSEGFLYCNAGRNRLVAVIGTGAAFSTRPYIIQDVTLYHTHLFTAGPKGIAVATGDGTFPERYVYVVLSNGSVVVGRYEAGKDFTVGTVSARWVGWIPYTGAGMVDWVSVLHSSVAFTTTYGNSTVCEIENDAVYLDGCTLVNATLPATLLPSAGQGPLWWTPNSTVVLMDGVQPLGEHQIDHLGNIVPIVPGEDLTSPTLAAGFAYKPLFEPFVPNAEPGQDGKQRTTRRRIKRAIVSFENSTGFLFQTLYAGPAGPLLPAPGTVIESRRVTAYNQDDNANYAPLNGVYNPPTLREGTETYRPTGRAYDPRMAIAKDTVGPLRLIEVGMEVTT